jgi:hypothetical protein
VRSVAFRGAAFVLLALGAADARAEDVAERYERHFTALSPCFVTLRLTGVAHVSMGGKSAEIEGESDLGGVVVDPSGIVLASNSLTGGPSSLIVRRIKEAYPGLSIDMEVRRLVLSLPGETAEREARIVARDGPLDLAWIQVLDAKEKPLPSVDLGTEGAVAIGVPLFTIARLERSFDHAPVLGKLRVAGRFTKPRPFWVASGDSQEAGGLAFDLSGLPVGAFTYQLPVGDDQKAGPKLAMLPLQAVRKSLEAARPLAAKALAEHQAAAAADGSKDGTVKDGAATDGGSKEGDAAPAAPEPSAPDAPS